MNGRLVWIIYLSFVKSMVLMILTTGISIWIYNKSFYFAYFDTATWILKIKCVLNYDVFMLKLSHIDRWKTKHFRTFECCIKSFVVKPSSISKIINCILSNMPTVCKTSSSCVICAKLGMGS